MMKKKEEKKAEDKGLLELLQRTQADFVNFKNRAEKEKAEAVEYGKIEAIKEILPIIDNLARAESHVPQDLAGNQWVQGITGIEQQFVKKIEEMGVTRIKTIGEDFDPNLHEAVCWEEKEGAKSNEIVTELEPGYLYKDKVIRYAKVNVAK